MSFFVWTGLVNELWSIKVMKPSQKCCTYWEPDCVWYARELPFCAIQLHASHLRSDRSAISDHCGNLGSRIFLTHPTTEEVPREARGGVRPTRDDRRPTTVGHCGIRADSPRADSPPLSRSDSDFTQRSSATHAPTQKKLCWKVKSQRMGQNASSVRQSEPTARHSVDCCGRRSITPVGPKIAAVPAPRPRPPCRHDWISGWCQKCGAISQEWRDLQASEAAERLRQKQAAEAELARLIAAEAWLSAEHAEWFTSLPPWAKTDSYEEWRDESDKSAYSLLRKRLATVDPARLKGKAQAVPILPGMCFWNPALVRAYFQSWGEVRPTVVELEAHRRRCSQAVIDRQLLRQADMNDGYEGVVDAILADDAQHLTVCVDYYPTEMCLGTRAINVSIGHKVGTQTYRGTPLSLAYGTECGDPDYPGFDGYHGQVGDFVFVEGEDLVDMIGRRNAVNCAAAIKPKLRGEQLERSGKYSAFA